MTLTAVKLLVNCVKFYFIYGTLLINQGAAKNRVDGLYGFQKEEMSV